MVDFKDLVHDSSIGEGLRWSAFGRVLREKRLSFRVKVSLLSRLANLPMGRILEIESGAPPFASLPEVRAIASAIGVDASSLESRMPRE